MPAAVAGLQRKTLGRMHWRNHRSWHNSIPISLPSNFIYYMTGTVTFGGVPPGSLPAAYFPHEGGYRPHFTI